MKRRVPNYGETRGYLQDLNFLESDCALGPDSALPWRPKSTKRSETIVKHLYYFFDITHLVARRKYIRTHGARERLRVERLSNCVRTQVIRGGANARTTEEYELAPSLVRFRIA